MDRPPIRIRASRSPPNKTQLLEAGGRAGRRADLRHRVRRPAPLAGAAGLSSPQLAARRAGRRRCGFRNHRRNYRHRRRRAPRSHGDEAVRRLQLRRLLVALDRHRREAQIAARDFSRQLVPPGRAGKFLWPGFSDNLRVLRWIIDRCKGTAKARETAIGHLPHPRTWIRGTEVSRRARWRNCSPSPALWRTEFEGMRRYLSRSSGPRAAAHCTPSSPRTRPGARSA
jgi:hypothetical protein